MRSKINEIVSELDSVQTESTTASSNITVTASTQADITPAWSLNGGSGTKAATQTWSIANTKTGISAGTYTLQNLIQELVSKSHTHSTTDFSYTYSGNTSSDCSSSGCMH